MRSQYHYICISTLHGLKVNFKVIVTVWVTNSPCDPPAFDHWLIYYITWITLNNFCIQHSSHELHFNWWASTPEYSCFFSLTPVKGSYNRSPVNPPPNREFYRNKTTGKKVHKVNVFSMVRTDMVQQRFDESKILVVCRCKMFVEQGGIHQIKKYHRSCHRE